MHSRSGNGPLATPQSRLSRALGHRRRRTISVVSVSPNTTSKIMIAVNSSPSTSTKTNGSALGSFTLTGCARDALLDVAFPKLDDDGYDEYGESLDSHDAFFAARDRDDDLPGPLRLRSDSSCTDVSIPSLSRTASPFQEQSSIPPGWGQYPRVRPRAVTSVTLPPIAGIHPILESLEHGSRVATGPVMCAACEKLGSNFPRCKHCAQMWCSRECRTSPFHRCHTNKAKQAAV
ncbi:hypothetical protein MIND_00317300 [Mycena indigotica]|uniref:Uncharacterized protein n=1 Tax=Mycena indigotica TaxID=2126181 RepID=A0A8H6T248_9AGAR|nr:uncharacterized protein MIND_00317300 [Mycena indigotica]KAF7309465.1 hypothetical protein MIND_00317300 [Mycena indigotica]